MFMYASPRIYGGTIRNPEYGRHYSECEIWSKLNTQYTEDTASRIYNDKAHY